MRTEIAHYGTQDPHRRASCEPIAAPARANEAPHSSLVHQPCTSSDASTEVCNPLTDVVLHPTWHGAQAHAVALSRLNRCPLSFGYSNTKQVDAIYRSWWMVYVPCKAHPLHGTAGSSPSRRHAPARCTHVAQGAGRHGWVGQPSSAQARRQALAIAARLAPASPCR